MRITAIKQQVKQAGRYSIFVDDKYAFSLSEAGLIESGLASGQELDTARLAALKRAAGVDKLYGQALRYVALRLRSEWELSDYFRRKGADPDAAASVIKRLRDLRFVDDTAFAQSWIQNRRLLKQVSRQRLRQELRQKHVPDAVVDQALQADAADDRQVLRNLIAKKQARYPDRQKLVQYLARQGFGFDDIRLALDELAAF